MVLTESIYFEGYLLRVSTHKLTTIPNGEPNLQKIWSRKFISSILTGVGKFDEFQIRAKVVAIVARKLLLRHGHFELKLVIDTASS